MSTTTKTIVLTAGIGLMLSAMAAKAALVPYFMDDNAPARCQAFTPGPTNTIRNRVAGAENVGTAVMNVACAMSVGGSMDGSLALAATVGLHNNTAAPMTVNCTLLTGTFTSVGFVVNKSSGSIAANAATNVGFSSDDTPPTDDTDLGSLFAGINCALPPGAVITWTESAWADEDGVGS